MGAVLALTNQVLQQDSRQVSTGLLRVVSILAMFLVLIVLAIDPRRASGLTFASWLLWLNYAGISLGAMSWFALAIAEEREQKTLGLLRMTGVHSAAILLGKWLPRLIVVQMLMLIQLPLAVLAVTMGGVTIYQLVSGYIALMAYAVMMSGIGLLWSVVCSHSRRAASNTLVCWLFHVPGVFLLKMFLIPNAPLSHLIPQWTGWEPWPWLGDLAESLHRMSLFRRMGSILATGFGEPLFETQVISNLLVGFGSFVIALLVFEFVTLYNLESQPKPRRNLLARFKPKFRKATRKRPTNVGRVWKHSMAWKEFFFSCGGWRKFFTKLFAYFGLSIGIVAIAASSGMTIQDAWKEIAGGVFYFVGVAGLTVEAAGLTGRMYQNEIKWETLPELMMLPISVARISYEKLLAILIALIPGASAVLFGCIIDPNNFGFIEVLFEPWGLAGFVGYVSFLHLSAWLSIHVRTGSLVLAFVVFWVGSFVVQVALAFLMSLGGWENAFYGGIGVAGVAFCVFMQFRIAKDLRNKGAA